MWTADQTKELASGIGRLVAQIHDTGLVHGDLTTSNILVRTDRPEQGSPHLVRGSYYSTHAHTQSYCHHLLDRQHDVAIIVAVVIAVKVPIDFGLSSTSSVDEDRAVDLYVLERAFLSTHHTSESLFEFVLSAYGAASKKAKLTLNRLEAGTYAATLPHAAAISVNAPSLTCINLQCELEVARS